jgi:hypothetical protein
MSYEDDEWFHAYDEDNELPEPSEGHVDEDNDRERDPEEDNPLWDLDDEFEEHDMGGGFQRNKGKDYDD